MAAPLKMILLPLMIFIMDMVSHSSTGTLLKNPDFKVPPTKLTAANASSTTPFLLTKGVNDLPGWSYSGEVWYVGSRHAVKLGKDGKLNQTLRVDDKALKYYTVSFSLGAESEECYSELTALNVSVADRRSWRVYSPEKRLYSGGGGQLRESHAFYLGGPWGGGPPYDSLEIAIESVSGNTTKTNASCWPVVDAFAIGSFGPPIMYSDNRLINSGFEQGPSFINQSSNGILLDDEPHGLESALEQWSIIGTVKYIDAKHYSVPKGKAAIQLIPSNATGIAPSGIVADHHGFLNKGTEYVLEFLMGDANDSCVADFAVQVQVGEKVMQNFTMRSEGNGSHRNFSMAFKVEISGSNPTRIMSFGESRNKDLALCGPVIDNVILRFVQSTAEANTMQLKSSIFYIFCLQAILFFVM